MVTRPVLASSECVVKDLTELESETVLTQANVLWKKIFPFVLILNNENRITLFYLNPEPSELYDLAEIDPDIWSRYWTEAGFLQLDPDFTVYEVTVERNREENSLIHFELMGIGSGHSLFASWEDTRVGATFMLADEGFILADIYLLTHLDHTISQWHERITDGHEKLRLLSILNRAADLLTTV